MRARVGCYGYMRGDGYCDSECNNEACMNDFNPLNGYMDCGLFVARARFRPW
jgi:hypothetical protein